MKAHVTLTVPESKRLIAKGVAAMEIVRKALKEGIVSIAKGTTNGRVVEEVTGESFDRSGYVTGRVLPSSGARGGVKLSASLPDVVLKNGEGVEGITSVESVAEMKKGDVFIKGCNAVNYQQKMGGILIGHTTGGTIGGTIGTVVARKIHLILPVGLEKSVYADMNEISKSVRSADEYMGGAPTLMPVSGHIVTEIEALEILAGVKAIQVAAGGVAGAEGSVWLLIEGDKSQVEKAMEIVDQCRKLEADSLF
ncbi:hypothetical protein GF312_05950 [Candidatus Poribacteria bacterium]|nr:hypothetical protein [Candidatus Poribacteria bacterium]